MGGSDRLGGGTAAICARPSDGGEEGEVVMMGAAGASIEEVVGVGGSEAAVGGGVRELDLVDTSPGESIAGSGGCSATGEGRFIFALLGCMAGPGRVGAAGGEVNGLALSGLASAGDKDTGE